MHKVDIKPMQDIKVPGVGIIRNVPSFDVPYWARATAPDKQGKWHAALTWEGKIIDYVVATSKWKRNRQIRKQSKNWNRMLDR